jgi:hypothetical protein
MTTPIYLNRTPAADNQFIVSYPKHIQLGIYRKGKVLYSSYIMELTSQMQGVFHKSCRIIRGLQAEDDLELPRAFVVAVMGSVLANYITKCLDWLITLIFG